MQLEMFEYRPSEDTIKLLGAEWGNLIGKYFESKKIKNLRSFLKEEREQFVIYPESRNVFRIFRELPPEKIKVILIGQDPYYNGQAIGRAFATSFNKPPVTLKYLLSASKSKTKDYTLQSWVDQGVFLLNSVLTVRQSSPSSHYEKGWEYFTEGVIKKLCESTKDRKLIFCFIGSKAKTFSKFVSSDHMIKEAEHPAFAAREERKWENEQLFQQINVALNLTNQTEIIW
ncbi:MAG: uracil-DNA glycosylase [Proteobacteria bacterium]|nr:uracil-DNA glycosylase [Pseudomonadota bacterium]